MICNFYITNGYFTACGRMRRVSRHNPPDCRDVRHVAFYLCGAKVLLFSQIHKIFAIYLSAGAEKR